MIADIDPEPDQSKPVLFVGHDEAGHWLVQESNGLLEGRFVSRSAAISFALSERHGLGDADVVITLRLLAPVVSFAPVGAGEYALQRAA